MRFVCENCLAQYMIKDEKIKPQGVKVRCKKCGYVMTLRPPDFEAEMALSEEATIRMPLPDEEEDEEAFFMDALVQSGEMPLAALGAFREEGFPLAAKERTSRDDWPKRPREGASAASNDLGSLFDDPELKSPLASGLFGTLDEEELGDAFERAISQRPTSSSAPSAYASEPSIVVSQGLSQAVGVEWFVAIGDSQVGPLDMRGMKTHWQQGKIGRDSLCWKSGMRDWAPIGTVEGLFEQLNVLSAGALSAEFSLPAESAVAVSAEWRPSAASALASLVQDELHGMSAAPPPAFAAEAVPYAAAAIPLPPAPSPMLAYGTVPPAPAPAYAASLSMPPVPAPYLPPAPPPSVSHKAMWAMAAAFAVVSIAVVVLVIAFVRSPTTPPPVTLAEVTPPAPPPLSPPPPPPPPVVDVPPPVAPAPEPVLIDSSFMLAQQFFPPSAPRTSKTTGRSANKAAASVHEPRQPTNRSVQDDFEKAFGGADASSAPTKGPGSKTVYVPPPPGGGAVKNALTDADIMEYILTRRAEVAACAREQKAKNPDVKGNMVVEWNIATSGRTSQVRLASPSTFQGTHFADCVMKLVQTWQFPAHRTAGGTRKFNFKI